MDSGLDGTRVLITGASGGIGGATARSFAAEGAHVILHFHSGREAAESLAEALTVDHGIRAQAIGADLRDEAECEALFEQAVSVLGGLDVLVVNHGIWPSDDVPVHRMALERWQETLHTDLTSAFLCCRAFLRRLAAGTSDETPRDTASIVFVGSTAAMFGEAGHADYAAAKAGMVYGLMRSLKNEIVGIVPGGRVNAVCPGWTDTPMAAGHADDPAVLDRVTATMALRKIAAPEDVASAIVFLASPSLAGHVSGAVLPVAGGMEGRTVWAPEE